MRLNEEKASILLIYTGGTIGMVENPENGALVPFDFQQIEEHIPEIRKMGHTVSTIQFDPPLDSSDINPASWIKMVQTIADNYDEYDGFVILHGTDTMSYTASALSFMLENLYKPVILTGSQLPIGMLRTDGKENLITAIEIAAAKENKSAKIPEVCIFFENLLMRGNRTTKVNADYFNAFRSYNYPPLAVAGIDIHYEKKPDYRPNMNSPLKPHYLMDNNVVILKLFPGINKEVVSAILNIPHLKGVVLETYGSGNASSEKWFIELLQAALKRGIVIVNVTQCRAGCVEMQRYETGRILLECGVVNGYDSTTESAITKLMFLFGRNMTPKQVKDHMHCSLTGEISIPESSKYC